MGSWSAALAVDLAKSLPWKTLAPFAARTEVPGRWKAAKGPHPTGKGKGKGQGQGQGQGDGRAGQRSTASTDGGSGNDGGEGGGEGADGVADVIETVTETRKGAGGGSKGPVSGRHLYVSLVCSLLRMDDRRTTLALLMGGSVSVGDMEGGEGGKGAHQGGKAPGKVPGKAPGKGGGAKGGGAKGGVRGAGGASADVATPGSFGGGNPLRIALAGAPLVDDDPRTLEVKKATFFKP
jgi:hypothetical protein